MSRIPLSLAIALLAGATGCAVVSTGPLPGPAAGPVPAAQPPAARRHLLAATPTGALSWVRQFGDSTNTGALAVAQGDRAAFVAGSTNGTLAGTNAGQTDAVVIRYGDSGRAQWIAQFGTSGFDQATAMAFGPAGAVAAGDVRGLLAGTYAGGSDGFLRAFTAKGATAWTHQFGTAAGENVTGASADATGYYVAGTTDGDLAGTNAGAVDAFVRKVDATGAHVWTTQLGTTDFDLVEDVAADGAGGVYVVGGAFADLDGTDPEVHHGSLDLWVARFDAATGARTWLRQLGSAGAEQALAVAADATGVYVAGYADNDFDGGGSDVHSGGDDVLVLRLATSDGTLAWSRQFGSGANDQARAIAVDANGVYVASANGTSILQPVDAQVRRLSFAGAVVWSTTLATSGADFPNGLASSGKALFLAGHTNGAFPRQPSTGGIDGFLAKFTKI